MATTLTEFSARETRWKERGSRWCNHNTLERVDGDPIPQRFGCLDCGEVFAYGTDMEPRGIQG